MGKRLHVVPRDVRCRPGRPFPVSTKHRGSTDRKTQDKGSLVLLSERPFGGDRSVRLATPRPSEGQGRGGWEGIGWGFVRRYKVGPCGFRSRIFECTTLPVNPFLFPGASPPPPDLVYPPTDGRAVSSPTSRRGLSTVPPRVWVPWSSKFLFDLETPNLHPFFKETKINIYNRYVEFFYLFYDTSSILLYRRPTPDDSGRWSTLGL